MCPTHTSAELPGAMAIALMYSPALDLIDFQRGPLARVFGAFALVVSHSESPPASSRFGLLGSSTKGEMNKASEFIASGMRKGSGFQLHSPAAGFQNCPLMWRSPCVSSVAPPSVLRWMSR